MSAEKVKKARKDLEKLREDINSTKPAKDIIPKTIQRLRPSVEGKKIKFFEGRITEGIKNKFREHEEIATEPLNLEKEGPTGSGPRVGKDWHKILERSIDDPTGKGNEAGKAVIDALKSKKSVVPNIEILQGEFPLYGFMTDEANSEISFWKGKVDAIGWFNDNYVIVDWKAINLLNFWKKHKYAYGDYLHQCLVYARLLKLHLNLDELPYILIVPINNLTGKDIHPNLFKKFPAECTEKIEAYEWSKDPPKSMIIDLDKKLVTDTYKTAGIVPDHAKVTEVFEDNITVKELLDGLRLKFSKLNVVA